MSKRDLADAPVVHFDVSEDAVLKGLVRPVQNTDGDIVIGQVDFWEITNRALVHPAVTTLNRQAQFWLAAKPPRIMTGLYKNTARHMKS